MDELYVCEEVSENFTKNKHLNALIRKKFKKSTRYICCSKPTGNKNKERVGYCCSYPMVYKRLNDKVYNKLIGSHYDFVEINES